MLYRKKKRKYCVFLSFENNICLVLQSEGVVFVQIVENISKDLKNT